jgi:hypothetical protein
MSFWQLAFNSKWITAEQLKQVVITSSNPFGEITEEEFYNITGESFSN